MEKLIDWLYGFGAAVCVVGLLVILVYAFI